MLYAFAFDRISVVAGDLYFLNPDPKQGQEGAEQGARVEVRVATRGERQGSVYAAYPIVLERPIWRADLLESVDHPGTLDRVHHHPRFRGWEPGRRYFADDMQPDPVAWVGRRLSDLAGLVAEVGASPDDMGPEDARLVQDAVPEVLRAVGRLLEGVRRGDLARPPAAPVVPAGGGGDAGTGVRLGWL